MSNAEPMAAAIVSLLADMDDTVTIDLSIFFGVRDLTKEGEYMRTACPTKTMGTLGIYTHDHSVELLASSAPSSFAGMASRLRLHSAGLTKRTTAMQKDCMLRCCNVATVAEGKALLWQW